MAHRFTNQALEATAKRMLARFTGSEEILKPLYLQPDRALFLAEIPWLLERGFNALAERDIAAVENFF